MYMNDFVSLVIPVTVQTPISQLNYEFANLTDDARLSLLSLEDNIYHNDSAMVQVLVAYFL
jgi:hypothetical protein